jgi:hypothetical protein
MLGIVKPSHRNEFKQRLVHAGLDPNAMRPILTVNDIRRRVYIRRNNQPFISVSFDDASVDVLWARSHFTEIEPELNEIQFTEANAEGRAYMEKINAHIIGTLMEKFPYLKRDLKPKYNKFFEKTESQIPLYRFLIRSKLDNANGLLLVGTLGLALLAGGLIFARKVVGLREEA